MRLLTIILILIHFNSLSQTCVTDEYNKPFIDSNPKKYKLIEENLQNYYKNKSYNKIIIPVVFHVVWINRIQNLSTNVIHQQLEVLNEMFNAQNTDTNKLADTLKNWVGNFNIKFEIAHRDPNGFPTNGITRKKTIQPHFSYWNDPVKKSHYGTAPWPTNRYLNIWICDLNEGSMGYAQFPGGPEETDGVVIDWQTVGNQIYPWTALENHEWAKGKVLTHEVGHWLNLFHPWGNNYGGCGEDFIPETSLQKGPIRPSDNCPDTLFSECQDSGRLFIRHYMDYAGSSCMVCFTKNQVLRGLASLHTYRSEMIENYEPRIDINGFENIKMYPTSINDKLYIEFPEYEGKIEILFYNLQGQLLKKSTIDGEWFHIIYPYELIPGIYLVNVYHNDIKVFSQKVLKNP
tara:strand:+ start:5175 stop:6383 length:1209 start_codon:yes stop_codon:yes gene_type:complete